MFRHQSTHETGCPECPFGISCFRNLPQINLQISRKSWHDMLLFWCEKSTQNLPQVVTLVDTQAGVTTS